MGRSNSQRSLRHMWMSHEIRHLIWLVVGVLWLRTMNVICLSSIPSMFRSRRIHILNRLTSVVFSLRSADPLSWTIVFLEVYGYLLDNESESVFFEALSEKRTWRNYPNYASQTSDHAILPYAGLEFISDCHERRIPLGVRQVLFNAERVNQQNKHCTTE